MSVTLMQVIVSGLLLGAVYALFSSGLTLIWGMMNVVNFAHGDFVMLGMYAAVMVWTALGGGPFAAVPVAAMLIATLGVLSYFLLGELVTPLRWLGITVICFGVFIVGRTAPSTTGVFE